MFIDLSGSPYEMGKIHGERMRAQIIENVEIVRNVVVNVKKLELASYMKHVYRNMEFVKQDRPDTAQEMQGLADGAGVPLDDIYLLNVQLFIQAQLLSDECMTMIARAPATLDGKTYMIKTRDIFTHMRHVVTRRRYPSGVEVCEVNPAGAVVWPGNGFNSHGLMVATTGAATANLPEMDLSVANRGHVTVNPNYILQACKNVDEVIDYIEHKHGPRIFRVNFFAVDHERAVCIEMSEDKLVICDADKDGLLFRSNYWRSEELKTYRPIREENPNNYGRYEAAEAFLRARVGRIRFQDMLEIAQHHDRDGREGSSICRHGAGGTAVSTYSILIILEDRDMFTALRNPCEALVRCESK